MSRQKATTISSPQGAILKEQLAPWTGYFAIFNGALLSVSNYVGVWFEVRARGAGWEAFRVARDSLGLRHSPCEGVHIKMLEESGEPLPSRAPSRAPSRVDEEEGRSGTTFPTTFERIAMASSETARGRGGGGNRPPRGDGDDPMTLHDLAERDEQPFDKGIQGKPPKDFKGDRSETCQFLTQFKRFMRLNLRTEIANNPISKASYFLTLI